MRQRFVLIGVILLLLVMPMISAEIMVSQVDSIYNLGEEFIVELEVDEFQEEYFDVDLICTNVVREELNLYHGILSAKIIQITRELVPTFISNLKGDCFIDARYGSDRQISQNFVISDQINIELELNELIYDAGSTVEVKGRAIKENGAWLNGYVEVNIGNESKASSIVTESEFNINFSISETTPAGISTIVVRVYDEDNQGTVLNQGEARADLTINQEAAWIEIAIDKQVVFPGDYITIIPIVYDNANMEMTGTEVLLKITDSTGNVVLEKFTNAEDEIVYWLETNHVTGHSRITVEEAGLIAEKIIDVQEKALIKAEIIEDKLIITNIGNIDYQGSVEISIQGNPIVKKVDLEKGEAKSYEVSAPDGEYDLIVKDDSGIVHQQNVALTGNAINIKEMGTGLDLLTRYPLIWIFLIILIAAIAFVMYRNSKKGKTFSFPTTKAWGQSKKDKGPKEAVKPKAEAKESKGSIGMILTGKPKNIVKPGAVTKAEHVLVLNGQRQEAGIIAIKVNGELDKQSKETINKAIDKTYKFKGVPCQIGNYFIIVFSPAVSKSFQTGRNAVKAAIEIDKTLKEHNSKFKGKIKYGIGVNVGEIINRVEGDKLKFASTGQTINLSKKIANIAEHKVLLSKPAHIKTRADVKVDKAIDESKINKIEMFRITKVIDSERNKKFISEFMRRI